METRFRAVATKTFPQNEENIFENPFHWFFVIECELSFATIRCSICNEILTFQLNALKSRWWSIQVIKPTFIITLALFGDKFSIEIYFNNYCFLFLVQLLTTNERKLKTEMKLEWFVLLMSNRNNKHIPCLDIF